MNGLRRWSTRLVIDHDQAAYLEAFERTIARASRPEFMRSPESGVSKAAWWQGLGALMPPILEQRLATADALEARLALARAALTAYRYGAAKTFEFLKDSIDPFDGRPLRCALGVGPQEGLVVFWSVGSDKSDDGGTDPTKDIVWRLKLK